MLLNDFKKDANHLFIEEGKTKVSMAEKLGVPKQYINTYINSAAITKRYIELVEALGYDIKVEYIKRIAEPEEE